MQIVELFIISAGLAMDALAVSISKGLALREVNPKQAATVGLWFGGFQMLMPLLGYFIGSRFWEQIQAVDHWVAFVILAIVGIRMMWEALQQKESETAEDTAEAQISEAESADLSVKTMLLLAIATSVDAMAVGITFALLKVPIWTASLCIGIITFLLSYIGMYIGHSVGIRFKKGATLLGGVLLIGIGVKILLEHLGLIL